MRNSLKNRIAATALAITTLGSGLLFAPASPANAAGPVSSSAAAVVKAGERDTKVSRSMSGIYRSAYVGKYFNSRYEAKRKCIVRKESRGNYRIRSSSGKYRGAYQFNAGLARATARKMGRSDLVNKPMNTWSRFDQDKAFWIVWNNGRGASHWPTRHGC
ncbi:MAG: hypothetical protein ACOYEV_08540 [Candidatus Nanopelagicales bacterium]